MNIELVVFDLAGTTVNDNKDVHRVLQHALKEHDVMISIEAANDVMGIPKPIAIRQLLENNYKGSRAITSTWIDEIHSAFVSKMIHFYETDTSVSEKEGVSETFRKLKELKLKIVVDTGFDRPITNALLQRLRWENDNLIDGSVTSDEVERGRPFPDLIFKAMALTNISNAKNVAKIGDTISDLQEGNAAGCGLVIGITTGAFSRDQLQKEKHTHLIEFVSEILPILHKV